MMKYYVIIHNNSTDKIDWNEFQTPDKTYFIITDSKSHQKLAEKQSLGCFNEFIILSDDFKDFSFDNLKAIVQGIIERYAINLADLTIATISEKDSTECAKLRQYFGINGDQPNDIERFRDKIAMKNALSRHQPAQKYLPRYTHFDQASYKNNSQAYSEELIAKLGLPIFAKPLSESSSRGTKYLATAADLNEFLATLPTDYDLEEYITGTLYHCDSVIENGKIKGVYIGRYLYPCAEAVNGKPLAGICDSANDSFSKSIQEFNQTIINGMDITGNACTHLEFFRTPSNKIKFVEIAKRPPGPLIPEMHHAMYNVDLFKCGWQLQTGFSANTPYNRNTFAAWFFIPKKSGTIQQLHEPKHLKSKYNLKWLVEPGDAIKENRESAGARVGEVLLWNDCYADLEQDLQSLEAFNFYSIKTTASKKNVANKRFVVLRQGSVLEDWHQYYQQGHNPVIIFCTQKIFAQLKQQNNLHCFEKIIVTEDFSFEHIDHLVQQNSINQSNIPIEFITSNENNVALAGKLNSKYADRNCKWTSDNTAAFSDKDKMKQCLGDHVRYPRYITTSKCRHPSPESLIATCRQLSYPLLAKPISGSGASGVTKIHSEEALTLWQQQCDTEEYEVDEFISGTLYHCDSVIQNGKVLKTFVSRYCHPCADFLHGKPNGSIPVLESSEEYQRLNQFATTALAHMPQLENVVTHMEVFAREDELIFLEVGARPGGGGIINMYQNTFGVTTTDLHFRVLLGLPLPNLDQKTTHYHAWLNIPHRAGLVTKLAELNRLELSSDIECEWLIESGNILTAPSDLSGVAAKITLCNTNYEQLQHDFTKLANMPLFEVTPCISDQKTTKKTSDASLANFSCFTTVLDDQCLQLQPETQHQTVITKEVLKQNCRTLLQWLPQHLPNTLLMSDGAFLTLQADKDSIAFFSKRSRIRVDFLKRAHHNSANASDTLEIYCPDHLLSSVTKIIKECEYYFGENIIVSRLEANRLTITLKNQALTTFLCLIRNRLLAVTTSQSNPVCQIQLEDYSPLDSALSLPRGDIALDLTQYEKNKIEAVRDRVLRFKQGYQKDSRSNVNKLRTNADLYNRLFNYHTHPLSNIRLNTGAPAFSPFYANADSFSAAISAESDDIYAKYSSRIPKQEMVTLCNKYLLEHQLIPENSTLNQNEVIFGNGSVQLFYMALTAHLNPGDIVLVPTPTYGIFLPTIYDLNCDIGFIDIGDRCRLTPAKLDTAIQYYNQKAAQHYISQIYLPKVQQLHQFLQSKQMNLSDLTELYTVSTKNLTDKIATLTNMLQNLTQQGIIPELPPLPIIPAVRCYFHMNPHNPSGAVYSQNEIDQLASVLSKHPEVLIIDDLAHFNIRTSTTDFGVFAKAAMPVRNVVSLCSSSKAFCQANVRAGFAYGSQALILSMQDKLSDTTTAISLPAQLALKNLFTASHKARSEYLSSNDAEYNKRHSLMLLLLQGYYDCELAKSSKLSLAQAIYHYLSGEECIHTHPSHHAHFYTARLLAGLPFMSLSYNPDAGFFLLVNIERVIGLQIGQYAISSSMSLRNLLREFTNIEVLPGELSGNFAHHTLRINITRTPEEMLDAFKRLQGFVSLLRHQDGSLPRELKQFFITVNTIENNTRLFNLIGVITQISDAITQEKPKNLLDCPAVNLCYHEKSHTCKIKSDFFKKASPQLRDVFQKSLLQYDETKNDIQLEAKLQNLSRYENRQMPLDDNASDKQHPDLCFEKEQLQARLSKEFN